MLPCGTIVWNFLKRLLQLYSELVSNISRITFLLSQMCVRKYR